MTTPIKISDKAPLDTDCCGQPIIPMLDKLSKHTNRHPTTLGNAWGWIDGCSLNICWSNDDNRFNSKMASALVEAYNNRKPTAPTSVPTSEGGPEPVNEAGVAVENHFVETTEKVRIVSANMGECAPTPPINAIQALAREAALHIQCEFNASRVMGVEKSTRIIAEKLMEAGHAVPPVPTRLSAGWVPSYNDPDNATGAPVAEPISDKEYIIQLQQDLSELRAMLIETDSALQEYIKLSNEQREALEIIQISHGKQRDYINKLESNQ